MQILHLKTSKDIPTERLESQIFSLHICEVGQLEFNVETQASRVFNATVVLEHFWFIQAKDQQTHAKVFLVPLSTTHKNSYPSTSVG